MRRSSNQSGSPAPQPPPLRQDQTAAPSWITPALIQQTLDCWQPHFATALTTEDAIEILTNVGQLFDALK